MNDFNSVGQPKKSNTGMIAIIVVVVLVCCCCIVVAGAFATMGGTIGSVFSSVNQQLTQQAPSDFQVPTIDLSTIPTVGILDTPEAPSEPTEASPTEAPTDEITPTDNSGIPSNLIPQGGLGDDILRADTWGYVLAAAAGDGCDASDASKTTIKVTSQPDSAGVWAEQWTVACYDGSNKSYNVTFTPSSQGGTDISVSASK